MSEQTGWKMDRVGAYIAFVALCVALEWWWAVFFAWCFMDSAGLEYRQPSGPENPWRSTGAAASYDVRYTSDGRPYLP